MAPSDNQREYKNYAQCLGRKLLAFACPKCRVVNLPKCFEEHCKKFHDFDTKCSCVWCWGKTTWKRNKRSENYVHLLNCFRKFFKPYEIAAKLENDRASKAAKTSTPIVSDNITITTYTPLTRSPRVIDVEHLLCPGRRFFDHESRYIREKLPKAALELFSILPVESHPLEYTGGNLNLAASYLAKYLETRDTHDWLHVMVKAVAFESFWRAMEDCTTTTTEIGLLPFSCWCDGGPYTEARHRQHRHMVAVAPKDCRFESEVWDKVEITEDRPCRNYPVKGMKRIVSPMHLVNTMGYLSKRNSRCEFTEKKNKKEFPKEKHFYIFTTLPVQYRLPLAVLWSEGVRELMYQEHFQSISIERLILQPLDRACSQWRQKIEDFYALPRYTVLPVDRKWVPATAERETELFVHLLNDRKLYFEHAAAEEELPDAETWLARQAAGGNCFYDAVGREWWIPRPRDQEKLNLVMPREYRIRELEFDIGYERKKYENQIDELLRKNEELNRKLRDMYEEEIKKLTSRVTELENKLEKCTCNSNSSSNNNNAGVNTNGTTSIEHLEIHNNNHHYK